MHLFFLLIEFKPMEDLTKHQLVLLTLLVSFITSIGTGIITFTLLQEAPVEVTQNISRVVERTIERVVPEPGSTDTKEKVVTTVVVNEEDKVTEAIDKNSKSIVRMKTLGTDGTEVVAGLGLVVSSNGTIAYKLSNFNNNSSYNAYFFDGKSYPTGKIYIDQDNGLVFIKTAIPKTDNSKYTFYPVTFGNSDDLKLGQTLIALSGKETNVVSIGRVRQLTFADDKKTVTGIISDMPVIKSYPGSPVITLSGEDVGTEAPLGDGDGTYSYIPANILSAATAKALAELAK